MHRFLKILEICGLTGSLQHFDSFLSHYVVDLHVCYFAIG